MPVDPILSRPVASAPHCNQQPTTPHTLDLKDIKELVALMRRNDLSVFKIEQEGFKITLKRGSEPVITTTAISAPAPVQAVAAPVAALAAPAASPSSEKLKEITSPMVGTFYASASPDSQAFAKPGTELTNDSVVCIIEAMKVMNEIKAEASGTVVEVVAENGKPVQYGQVLFRIRAK